jgi:hypothetical protein
VASYVDGHLRPGSEERTAVAVDASGAAPADRLAAAGQALSADLQEGA